MKNKKPHYLGAPTSLSAGEGLILPDGSIWSHAATLGKRKKGDEFTIGAAEVTNAVKVFTSGYPRKVPVDYEHASTTSDPEVRKLRAQGAVPKAGDVLELKAVLAVGDFEGELKTTAEKLSELSGRTLDDPRNLGLWMRWKPTSRALASVKAGEYSELSIAFDEDVPNNVDGTGQGFGILAVALCMRPFLDDMLPVAASRDTDPPPADLPASREGTMKSLVHITALAAIAGATVTSDEEAVTELPKILPKIKADREYTAAVATELGITDPAKAVERIKQLTTENAEFKTKAEKAVKDAAKATAEATVKEYEANISSAPLRKMLVTQLTGELEAGKELEKTETLATLKSLGKAKNLGQSSAGDTGDGAGTTEDKVVARAKELMASDPEIKELAKSDRLKAYNAAVDKAEEELSAGAAS
jgi:hypothetical protein